MPGSRGLTFPASGNTGKAPLILCGGLWPCPGAPVLYTVGVVEVAVRRRLVEAWEATWRALPVTVRDVLLRHWAQRDIRECYGPPRVVLVPELLGQWAHVDANGYVMRVALAALGRETAWVSALLAHELAHVHQAACGEWFHVDNGRLEHDAEWATWAWGFPQP